MSDLHADRLREGNPEVKSGRREEIYRLRRQISDNAIRASRVLAKQAEELSVLRWVIKGAHGALTDAGSVVVPGTLESDIAPAIRQLTRERDEARAALRGER